MTEPKNEPAAMSGKHPPKEGQDAPQRKPEGVSKPGEPEGNQGSTKQGGRAPG